MLGLELLAPRFLVPAKRVKALYEPSDFYAHICNRIRSAKSRVFLASLYLGQSESGLIDVIAESLQFNANLQVHVLVDALRGTREAPATCSASLLVRLARQFPNRVHLSLYETPKMGRLISAILPKRIIEGVGLQHMKIYGWDDEVLLSGANLSADYFTNRQDRYILIDDRKLANWYYRIHQSVASLSYKLLPAANESGFRLVRPEKRAVRVAKGRLAALLTPRSASKVSELPNLMENEVVEVYPIGQFTPLRMGNEHAVINRLTQIACDRQHNFRWMFTAGYFNIEPQLARNLANSQTEGEIVVASPQANGFYQSKGLSGKIPTFYSYFAASFLRKLPLHSLVRLREWKRGVVNLPGGWSYHAKGLWMENGAEDYMITYIGSSNFTKRSYRHDIECGAVLVAKGRDNSLKQQLQHEMAHLKEHCGDPLTLSSPDSPQLTSTERWFLKFFGDRL